MSLFGAALIFTFSSNGVFAAESAPASQERFTIVTEDGYQYLKDNQEGVLYSDPVTTDGKSITLEEYKNILEQGTENPEVIEPETSNSGEKKQTEDNSNILRPLSIIEFYTFNLTTQLRGADPAYKYAVSAGIKCPAGTTPCTITSQWQKTTAEQWSVNVESGWKDYIRIGGSYQFSSQVTNSNAYTLPINPGKIGHMAFTPYMITKYGTITTDSYIDGWYAGSTTSSQVMGKGAEALPSGEANGIYSIVYDG